VSEGTGTSSRREAKGFEFTVRTLVEKKYVVDATTRVEAELIFAKERESGVVNIEGVVQSISCRLLNDLQIDPDVFEVLETSSGDGRPTFYTVIHKKSGLRKTKSSLEAAYSKVIADLSRRNQSGHHLETPTS